MPHPRVLRFLAPSLALAALAAEDTPAPIPAAADAGVSVSASMLFQTFRNAGEDYAIPRAGGVVDISDGPIEQSDAGFAPGFSLGMAWKPAGSGISYGLDLMYLSADEDDALSDATRRIYATQIHPDESADISDNIGRATATVETSMLRIDLLLGRERVFDGGVTCGFRGGLSYLQFTNDRRYGYFEYHTPTPGEDEVVVEREQEFTGFGATVEASLRSRLGLGFSAFGNLGFTLLTGSSDLTLRETEPDDGDVNVDNDASIDHLVTAFRLAVGVGWETVVAGNPLAIDLSYELEQFQGLKRDIEYVDDVVVGTVVQTSDGIGRDGLRLAVGYRF